jgi:hypothetical protein
LIDAFRDAAIAARARGSRDRVDDRLDHQAVKSASGRPRTDRAVGPIGDSLRDTWSRPTRWQELEPRRPRRASCRSRVAGDPQSQALQEITAAARSMSLADSLERDPSAIVRGRAAGEAP